MTELTPTESENPLSGYGKTVSHVVVGLKTVKGTKQLRLDPSIYEAILKEKIVVGDVIYVEANTGAVKVSLPAVIKLFSCCDTSFVAGRSLRRVCFIIRSRIGDLRTSAERRCAQTQRAGTGCDARRFGCGQRETTRWTGHHECHGESSKEREDGGYG